MHWLFWASRRIIIKFLVINVFFPVLYIHHLIFGNHRWAMDALFYSYSMIPFNYDDKEARHLELSCRCHLSNTQIVSSVKNITEAITCLRLCVKLRICFCLFCSLILLLFFHYCFYVFNSVFLFAWLFPLFLLGIAIHGKYHNFGVLFLCFGVFCSYLFINLLLFFFCYILMELMELQEYRLAVSLSLF